MQYFVPTCNTMLIKPEFTSSKAKVEAPEHWEKSVES